jgi:16S rRNA processing protein RimM
MTKEDCYELGYIAKPIGLKGDVAIVLDVDFPEDYEDLEAVLIEIDGELIPFVVEKISFRGNKIVLKLEEIKTVEEAEKLRSQKLYLPLIALPPLEKGQYYLHELVGYQIDDIHLGNIGEVKLIYNLPAQDLLAVIYKDVEVMIPINDSILLDVNHEMKSIKTNLPDGLLEIYVN